MFVRSLAVATLACLSFTAQADVALGAFNFNSATFGNTLSESDGGTYSASNWLNTSNANPGNPGYLTGANFNTGIANIGLGGTVIYTIGYNTAIVNGAGADLGIVTAHFSSDRINFTVSADGGTSFAAVQTYTAGAAVNSGVNCSYFYGGSGGPYGCGLFVTAVDLSDFGIALGASVNAVQIGSTQELDLIRVAGFGDPTPTTSVPEPTSLALMGLALAGLATARRRKV